MKLYYAPRTRASRVRWVLEELAVPFELETLDRDAGEHKTPEYMKIHPLGKLPALVDGDVVMFETGAICLYLADRFADRGLAPPVDGPDRPAYLQWVMFGIAELEPAVLAHYGLGAGSKSDWAPRARVVADAVRSREFIAGDRFSVADVMIGGALGWAKPLGLLDGCAELVEYGRRVGSRPAAKRARDD